MEESSQFLTGLKASSITNCTLEDLESDKYYSVDVSLLVLSNHERWEASIATEKGCISNSSFLTH